MRLIPNLVFAHCPHGMLSCHCRVLVYLKLEIFTTISMYRLLLSLSSQSAISRFSLHKYSISFFKIRSALFFSHTSPHHNIYQSGNLCIRTILVFYEASLVANGKLQPVVVGFIFPYFRIFSLIFQLKLLC